MARPQGAERPTLSDGMATRGKKGNPEHSHTGASQSGKSLVQDEFDGGQASGVRKGATGTDAFSVSQGLGPGASGPQVLQLQQALMQLKLLKPDDARTEQGKLGLATQAALRRFAKKRE